MKSTWVGVALGITSVVFSTLCFLVMPAFTAAIILAILFGVPSGVVALLAGARRTGLVTLAFAPMPLLGFLLLENAAHLFGSGYIAFLAPGVAFMIALWSAIDYLRAGRAAGSAAV